LFNKKVWCSDALSLSCHSELYESPFESSKKRAENCRQAMINVSEYIKDIHRVDEAEGPDGRDCPLT